MHLIITLLIEAVVIMALLPRLGLITFTGTFGTAIGATIVLIISAFVVVVLLWPALLGTVFPAAFAEAILGDGSGQVASFVMNTMFMSLCLWITSGLMARLVLHGFWSTIGAGALLVVTDKVVDLLLK